MAYNRTSTGDPQLTFPAVSDRYRNLGSAYYPQAPRRSNGDIQMGDDQYGWGADAVRMANARVQSTISAYPVFNRTPRFRITPTASTDFPSFNTKDESNTALERLLSISLQTPHLKGSGSIGALTTPEGQRYARKILDRRANELDALNARQSTAPVRTERALTEVEADKTKVDLELAKIMDEVRAGLVERGTAEDFFKWTKTLLGLLAYYNDSETHRLISYERTIGDLADSLSNSLKGRMGDSILFPNLASPRSSTRFSNLQAVEYMDSLADRILGVITQYMKIIHFELKERVLGLRAILRSIGMADIAKSIRSPSVQDVSNDMEVLESSNPFAFAQPVDEQEGEPPVPQPREQPDELPPYRTQAEITAEINRLSTLRGLTPNQSAFMIAQEWSRWTGYMPRQNTPYISIRRTLVERIKRIVAERQRLAQQFAEADAVAPAVDNAVVAQAEGSGRRRRRR